MISYSSNIRKYEQFVKEFWSKLAVGDYIRVKKNTEKSPHVFAGCIESKYPDYIVIKGKRYRECFHRDAFYCRDVLITDYAPGKKKFWVNSAQNIENNIKICQNEIDPFKSILEGIWRG